MNTKHFFQAISDFDNGMVNFNLGDKWSFLFNQKWYPTRAFMRHYLQLIGEANDQIVLYQAVNDLSKFIPVFSHQVNFIDHSPVNL